MSTTSSIVVAGDICLDVVGIPNPPKNAASEDLDIDTVRKILIYLAKPTSKLSVSECLKTPAAQ